MPFDRNPDGTIYQRPFGGHTANYGEKPVQRACAAADRTGHAMLHTLYQQNVKARTNFFVEWMALDLIRDAEGAVVGVTALEMETGAAARAAGQGGDARDRRRRADLRGVDQRLHQHRRRPRHGGARRPAARGHGVLAVPPDRRLRRRRAAHRRLPRRGRDPAQQRRRALHGALRADPEGPRAARLRLALHGPGDQGRARLRARQGLHRPRHDAPRRRHDQEAPAERARDRPQLRQRRHHARADPGRADDPLPDGRRADQRARPGRGAEGRRSERGRARASTPSASARASACTAPTGSAPIRCSTCSSSAAPPATTSSPASSRRRRTARCRRRPPTSPPRGWRVSTRAPAASTRRRSPTTCARRCSCTPASSAPRRRWTKASARCRRSPSAPGRCTWPTSRRSSTPRASRRSRSTT